jgi:hypothetical protein
VTKVVDRMVRVLIYPNLTYPKDLEKDSHIIDAKTWVKQLNSFAPNYWFYTMLPSHFDFGKNVTNLEYHLPAHSPTMRVHFDTAAFKTSIRNTTFDVVFSCLPEHTHAIKSVLENSCSIRPPFVGYCHWFDFPEVVTWGKGSIETNLLGILNEQYCFLNTKAQIPKVLREAKKLLASGLVEELKSKLHILHPPNGCPIVDRLEPYLKIIVFNHRPWKYKNFDGFMATLDQLRERRTDFRVWIPLLDKPNRDWVFCNKYDKAGYYAKLGKCCVGYAPEQKYGGWSVATVDGLSRGVPYIMQDADYYREIQKDADFFSSNDEAVNLLDRYLSNGKYRQAMANKALHAVRRIDSTGKPLHRAIQAAVVGAKQVGATDALDRMMKAVYAAKRITEPDLLKKMGWGKTMPFSKYRNALIADERVGEEVGPDPVYVWRG